ncbi:MAG: hypothetical protein LKJ83_04485 [Eubacteriaceae bacterium]|jgi:hypothetical protein|nr:hypothetical protein [Eubacteriaceae bacterium]
MQTNIAFRVLIKRIKAIRFMMLDRTVSVWKKIIVVFGIVFLFVSNLIPALGLISDIILWVWILWYLKDTLDQYWLGDKTMDLSKKFSDKDPIDDVDFEVKYSEDSDRNDKNDHKDGGSDSNGQ